MSPTRVQTRFAVASGLKGYTAAVTMALVERGRLSLTTTARSLLGSDLPLIDDHVTIEQLLSHRSGIGDYLDESADRLGQRLRDGRAVRISSTARRPPSRCSTIDR